MPKYKGSWTARVKQDFEIEAETEEEAREKTKKKGNVEAFVVNYKRTDAGYAYPRQITLVKAGRRVHFSEEHDTDALNPAFVNISLGIKTAARAFQDAIDGKVVRLTRGVSYFTRDGGRFALQRTGRGIEFVAPCGETGYLTVSEAVKVVAALRSLFEEG